MQRFLRQLIAVHIVGHIEATRELNCRGLQRADSNIADNIDIYLVQMNAQFLINICI